MKIRHWTLLLACTLILSFAACSGNKSPNAETGNGVKLQGAGASFPAPLYKKWFKAYSGDHRMCWSTISRSAAAAASRA